MGGDSWNEWKAYYRRVRIRARENLWAHFRDQVVVSLVIGSIAALIAVSAGQGAASLVYGAGGAGVWAFLAAGFYGLRAPVELDRESRVATEEASVARDVALAERDEARGGGRMPVHVTRVEPHPYTHEVLLRLLVINAGSHRATYYAEVVAVEGSTADGPEKPYPAAWRGRDNQLRAGAYSLTGDGEQMIDVAIGGVLDAAGARSRSADSFRAPISVLVAGATEAEQHAAPFAEVRSVEDLLDREIVLTYVITHEESDEKVARTRVRLWYVEREGRLLPDMQIIE